MAEHRRSGKLAVILHADIAGSTGLVKLDEHLAHDRIQETFQRFSNIITKYHGRVRELRGDALLAEFERASGAVSAALAFQTNHKSYIASLNDPIQPAVRVGIAMGEVVIADKTITGEGVVLAQRLEQLAEPGDVVIQGAAYETIPGRFPFEYDNLGEHTVKGFDEPIRVYSVRLSSETDIPEPEQVSHRLRNTVVAFASVAIVATGIALMWIKPWETREEPASVARMAFPLPDKPSIAILPFNDLSDSDEHTYIAEGLTENIITTLGKISGLFVVDRGAVTRYSDESIKSHQVSEELGVRYILKGSVQKSGDRLRVTTTLVDTSTGHHVWSERYDRDITDLFSVQDEITGRIVVELQVNLTEGEQARLKYDSTTNFDAWTSFMRGSDSFSRFTKEDNAKARELFERAVDLDPHYAIAWGWLAWTHWIDARFGFSESREVSFTRAEELAAKAVELDPELADALSLLGAIHLYKREYDEALDKGRMAIDLGPNNANIHATVAITTYSVGDWGETIKLLKRAMRLSPYYPSWYLLYLGRGQTFQGDYKEAIATLEKGLARADSLKSAFHTALAFAHMEAGNEQQAREFMARTLEVSPHYSASYVKKVNFFKDTNDLDRLIGALQKAGMPENPPLKLPDKPSIAVLPFTNMSNDSEQEFFVDGMTEDLITDLSKISGLFVIARNSSFAYKGKAVDVKNVARDLGVRYILEGSVRRAGDQVRINAQLIDTTTGGHLWANRYDGSMTDVFTVQDKVTQNVVAALKVHLTDKEKVARAQQETNSPEAYDAFLRGRTHYDLHTQDDFAKAIQYLEKAVQLDPNYARVHGVLAAVYWDIGSDQWAPSMGMDYDYTVTKMEHHLKKALRNPTPIAHHIASRLLTAQGRNDEAIAESKRAIALDPNDASGYTALARIYIKVGRPAEALEALQKGQRLDPQGDVRGTFSYWLGESYFHLDRFEESAAEFEKQVRLIPGDVWGYLYLAAAYGYLGRKLDAESALAKFDQAREKKGRRHYSLADVDEWSFPDETIRERLREGLRKAGVPQGSTRAPLAYRGLQKAPLEVEGATTIDVTEAKALFDRGIPFVDVRSDPNWPRGYIPGAVHLNRGHDITEANLSKVVPKDGEVVIYACGVGCGVTARVVAIAVSLGFTKVYFLRTGFPSWKAAGYPVEIPSG